ncbi:MAG TPA: histidinol-phosphate transaminase [Caulobacterales bacterium]|nr:histidinol-phosphate transaminase [Caulobacterales bacterium]
MAPKPLPAIAAIEPYKGGESVLPGIDKPVKLASNENPFGPSPKAKAAYVAAAEKLHIYPEGSARVLREAIAARYGLDASRIICGAGSDEIFFLLARAFLEPGDEIIVPEHAFSIYAIAAHQSGAVVREAKCGLTADVDAMLALVTTRTKIVFIANPNNPTGTYLPFAEVRRLQAGLPDDVLLVIDAAYAEYVRRNDYSSGLELAAETENVIMTRTFSKIYGMASARLGWGYGPPVVIEALNKTRGPFNVGVPAMMAGVAAIQDQEFLERSVDHNDAELPRVTEALEAMGLKVTPSVGNFVLVHFTPGKAAEADAHLRKRGYILRAMKGYGLPDALRMTIGTAEQNDGALAALKEFVK